MIKKKQKRSKLSEFLFKTSKIICQCGYRNHCFSVELLASKNVFFFSRKHES